MMNKIKCPICGGSGELEFPANRPFIKVELDLPKIAKTLRDEGYSIREIASIMGFKHPGSVSHLLDNDPTTPTNH